MAAQSVREVACAAGGTQRIALDVAAKVNPRFRGSALQRMFERQNKALRSFCPLPPADDIPDVTVPFQGGQCPGTTYRVNYIRTRSATIVDEETFTFAVGPVGGFTESVDGNGILTISIVDMGGSRTRTVLQGNPDVISASITSVVREDGQPDDCGNPPQPPLPPGSPPPTDPRPPDTNIDINLPGIGITNVVFAPVVGIIYADVDARVKIPVKVNVNIPAINFNFDVDFNIDLNDPDADPEPNPGEPDLDDDGRPQNPDCPLPPECGEEEDPEPEGEADEEARDEKGLEVVAAIVKAVKNLDPSRATEINQEDAPNIFAPAIGFINFVYETSEGEVVYSSDIRVKNMENVIQAPNMGIECVGVVGTPNQGFDWELFQVLGKRDTGGCCGS